MKKKITQRELENLQVNYDNVCKTLNGLVFGDAYAELSQEILRSGREYRLPLGFRGAYANIEVDQAINHIILAQDLLVMPQSELDECEKQLIDRSEESAKYANALGEFVNAFRVVFDNNQKDTFALIPEFNEWMTGPATEDAPKKFGNLCLLFSAFRKAMHLHDDYYAEPSDKDGKPES
ncbi:hypothetical protein P4C99_20115 [Pontiellaceae bacterium B1224]|nr:hypothetical protein [Pontiellaceae bacterium B1224]